MDSSKRSVLRQGDCLTCGKRIPILLDRPSQNMNGISLTRFCPFCGKYRGFRVQKGKFNEALCSNLYINSLHNPGYEMEQTSFLSSSDGASSKLRSHYPTCQAISLPSANSTYIMSSFPHALIMKRKAESPILKEFEANRLYKEGMQLYHEGKYDVASNALVKSRDIFKELKLEERKAVVQKNLKKISRDSRLRGPGIASARIQPSRAGF